MVCQNCQSTIADGAPLCPECGARVSQAADPLNALQGCYEVMRKSDQCGSGNFVQRQSVEASADFAAPPPATATGDIDLPLAGSGTGQANSPRVTTGLAQAAMWLGIGSTLLMALGLVMVLIGVASSDRANALPGLGVLVAVIPTVLGPTAAGLGFAALFNQATQATKRGRRDAIIGMATGTLSLLLCCGLLAAFPSTEFDEGGTPGSVVAGNVPYRSFADVDGRRPEDRPAVVGRRSSRKGVPTQWLTPLR